MLTAILVELDGVLVDTRTARADALAAALAAVGLDHLVAPATRAAAHDPSASFDDVLRSASSPAADAPPAAPDDTALALVALRAERAYHTRLAAGVTLAPGARSTIEALGAATKLAVVTAWRRDDAERVLANSGFGASVRFVAAADDGPGFASAAGRYARAIARAIARARHVTTGRSPARSASSAGAIAALVGGAAGFAAAQAAGARAVLIGPPLPLLGLTPARLATALDAGSPSLVPSPQLHSPPRR